MTINDKTCKIPRLTLKTILIKCMMKGLIKKLCVDFIFLQVQPTSLENLPKVYVELFKMSKMKVHPVSVTDLPLLPCRKEMSKNIHTLMSVIKIKIYV